MSVAKDANTPISFLAKKTNSDNLVSITLKIRK
jgi:hypothetical protein